MARLVFMHPSINSFTTVAVLFLFMFRFYHMRKAQDSSAITIFIG